MPSNEFGEIIRDGEVEKTELSEEEKESLRKIEEEARALHERQGAEDEEVNTGTPVSDDAASMRRAELRKKLVEGGGA